MRNTLFVPNPVLLLTLFLRVGHVLLGEPPKHWGVPDATTVVHHLLNVSIPREVFGTLAVRIEVEEAGKSSLPEWLYYDDVVHSLLGVPQNVGTFYFVVTAKGMDISVDLVQKDVFLIDVTEESSLCSDQTMASLLLDLEHSHLSPQRKVGLISKLSEKFKIPIGSIQLKPAESRQIMNSLTIKAGPGNALKKKSSGVFLHWPVSCNAPLDEKASSIVAQIEKSSADGTLAHHFDAPIIGWQLAASRPQVQLSREKRFFRHRDTLMDGTPIPGLVIPTWYSSTDDIYKGYTETDLTPESRIVPTMASPIFPSSIHHHRHHHGEGKIDKILPIEPSRHFVLQAYSTPLPFPERPSIQISPSFTMDEITSSFFHLSPTFHPTATQELPIISTAVDVGTLTSSISPTTTSTKEEPTMTVTNVAPRLQNHIPKLTMVVGKMWTYPIPSDTFWDFEDGNTSSLKLFFYTADKTALLSNSWIQFDPEEQKIIALPLEEHIGTHEFILEAMDSEENTTQDRIEIDVWENLILSKYHHAFIMTFKYESWHYIFDLAWQFDIIKKIDMIYGDEDGSSITVLRITYNPYTITWTNHSLPTDHCPKQEIEEIAAKIIKDNNMPTKHLKRTMQPTIRVQKIGVEFTGICILPEVPYVATTEKTTKDFSPRVYQPIYYINVTVGEVLRYKIHPKTFMDFEDGDTRSLELSLLSSEDKLLQRSSWILLDPDHQELFGLPMDEDIGEHEFHLQATDMTGLSAQDIFFVYVNPRKLERPSFQVEMVLNNNFEEFNNDLTRKILLPWKIAKLFRDNSPKYIRVLSVREGSVMFSWTNSSFPDKHCAANKLREFSSLMIDKDGAITETFLDEMKPEFNLTELHFKPQGVCLKVLNPIFAVLRENLAATQEPTEIITISISSTEHLEPTTTNETLGMAEPTMAPDADIYITTIIPAVVVAVMLVIAAMIACFLYRKRRKMKNYTQDSAPYMTKGVPIIFSDELEEKSGPAKAPMIMKEERGPLIPRHHHYDDESHESVPLTEPKMIDASFHGQPPYNPPPPFPASTREARGARPKVTSGYRQPPPYCVPP